jgi:uncharacterized protein (DUF433 family)
MRDRVCRTAPAVVAAKQPEGYNSHAMATPVVRIDPQIMQGIPCFTGTRVPVKNLFDYIAANHTIDDFLADFPTVNREQVDQVLDLARTEVAAAATPAA